MPVIVTDRCAAWFFNTREEKRLKISAKKLTRSKIVFRTVLRKLNDQAVA
jgi:hypothetical protein